MKNKIFIIESGWIIVGIEESRDADMVRLTETSVVRRWTNGRGIGGLAKVVYKSEYTLDSIGDVDICAGKILFEIPCEW